MGCWNGPKNPYQPIQPMNPLPRDHGPPPIFGEDVVLKRLREETEAKERAEIQQSLYEILRHLKIDRALEDTRR